MTEQKSIAIDKAKEIAGFLAYVLVTVAFIPAIALFAFGGISEAEFFDKTIFYYALGGIGFTVLVIFSLLDTVFPGKGFVNLISNAENSLALGFLPEKYLTASNIISVSIIFFAVFGIFATQTNTFFTGIPFTQEQQVTETGDILLNTEPASTSETLLIVALIAIVYWITTLIFHRLGVLGIANKIYSSLISALFGLIAGFILHLNRYSGSEAALLAVIFFWGVGSLITTLTQSIYPFAIWHFANNFFLRLNHFVGDDAILIGTIIFIVLYIAAWVSISIALRNIREPTGAIPT